MAGGDYFDRAAWRTEISGLNACAWALAGGGTDADIVDVSNAADVTIYTTGLCGFCFAAKRLLDGLGVAYTEHRTEGRQDLRQWIAERSGQRTVPQVFINGEAIGGYSELAGLHQAGELVGKLTTPPPGDFSPLPS